MLDVLHGCVVRLLVLISCAVALDSTGAHHGDPPEEGARVFEISDPSQIGELVKMVEPDGATVRKSPGAGDPAPELTAEGVLDGVSGLTVTDPSLASWRGRSVVLEFSAGWCGPCRATAPHMNELVEAFRDDERLAFLTITNEGKPVAKEFRDAVEMVSPLAFDEDGSTWQAYGVRGVPAIVLIDREGKIVAKGHPADLNKDVLEAFARGEHVALESAAVFGEGEEDAFPVNWNMGGMAFDEAGIARMLKAQQEAERIEGVDDAVAFTLLRPATARQSFKIGGMDGEPEREVKELGAEPLFLVSACTGVAPEYIDDRAGLPMDKIYDLFARSADGRLATAQHMGMSLLENAFGFTTREEQRATRVKLLRRVDSVPMPEPRQPQPGEQRTTFAGRFDAPDATMGMLASYLEPFAGMPVVDDTGVAGAHDLTIVWNLMSQPGDKDGLVTALREQGFELVDGERPVRFLVLEAAAGR